MTLKKKLLAGLVIGALTTTPWALAAEKADKTPGNAETKAAVEKLKDEQTHLYAAIEQTVMDAFKDIQRATVLLSQKGKEKEAIAALSLATGKFDIALAANPKLGLVPIDASVIAVELITTPEQVRKNIKTAIDLLEEGKVQEARHILVPMQDELVSQTLLLPMQTYPDVIKEATKQLVAGDTKKAIATLAAGLNTFVVTESVVPLGLVRAEALVTKASKLDKEKDKEQIKKLLSRAAEEVETSTLLGYAEFDPKAFESIRKQIAGLRKEVEGPNKVEKLYAELKKSLHELIGHTAKQQATGRSTLKAEGGATSKK